MHRARPLARAFSKATARTGELTPPSSPLPTLNEPTRLGVVDQPWPAQAKATAGRINKSVGTVPDGPEYRGEYLRSCHRRFKRTIAGMSQNSQACILDSSIGYSLPAVLSSTVGAETSRIDCLSA